MTEEQLTRLLRRLAVVTKSVKVLAPYVTAKPAQSVTLNSGQVTTVLQPTKYRWAVSVGPATASGVVFGWNSPQISANNGIVVNTTTLPQLWRYEDLGFAICGALHAFSTAPNVGLSIQEFVSGFPLDGSIPFMRTD